MRLKYWAFSILRLVFFGIAIYGLLSVISEAEPWTPESQIWIFLRGILLILVGVVGYTLVNKEDDTV